MNFLEGILVVNEIVEPSEWFFSFLPPEFNGKNESYAIINFENSVMTPFIQKYYSKIPTVFSYDMADDSNIDGYELVILRDGLFTLLPFLIFNESKIISTDRMYAVNYKFRHLIPESLDENIVFYKLDSVGQQIDDREKLLIIGVFAYGSITKEYIREYLKIIEDIISKKPDIELEVFLHLGKKANVEVVTYFVNSLKKIKRISKFWDEKDFDTISRHSIDFSNYYISDINPGLIYAEDFVVYTLLSLGGMYLNSFFRDFQVEDELYQIELSNYHRFILFEDCLDSESDFDSEIYLGIKMLYDLYKDSLENKLLFQRFSDDKDNEGRISFIFWDQYLRYLKDHVSKKLRYQ